MFEEIKANCHSINRRKPVYGVGINDAPYKVKFRVDGKVKYACPYYLRWVDMLKRCYGRKYQAKSPSYKGCFTCKEWLVFSAFKLWMEKQNWQGMSLDKDIIKKGNKEYCEKFCSFVPTEINNLILMPRVNDLPVGVSFCKRNANYKARLKKNNKECNIGRFDSPEEAGKAYLTAKSSHIKEVSLKYFKDGLINLIVFNSLNNWVIN